MPERKRPPDQLPLIKPSRADRIAAMDEEILDLNGAARVLGVSTRTVYALARKGEIPAMRIGREWRFALKNLRESGSPMRARLTNSPLRCGMVVW